MAGVREVQRAVAVKMIEMAGSGEPALAAYARTRTRGLPMIQHAQEITAAGAWLLAHGPLRRVIEIGTHHGGTVAYWGELGAERIVAVDLPSGDFGGIGEQAADERDAQLAKLYPGYVCVRGDSHDPATVLLVEDSLHGRADLLFIDADHSYEGVRQDYFVYKHLVRPGGVILFHDIVESETHKRAGAHVYRLWQELQGEKVEFVCGADWGGLGALVVKE
jgi:cephalosporin hydroxylase